MNTIKNYYLIIPIDDVHMKETKGNCVITNWNTARNKFTEYRIPEEFQRIILKVSIGGLTPPKDAFELLTNEMFYFKTPIIEHILNKKDDTLIISSHSAEIYTNSHIYHAEAVKKFYQAIIDAGLAFDYEGAVREIFNRPREDANTIHDNKILKKEY